MHDFLDLCAPFDLPSQARSPRPRRTYPTHCPSLDPDINAARVALHSKGWTYRDAAAELGVHPIHLTKVLTGRRESRRLLAAIHALPNRNA